MSQVSFINIDELLKTYKLSFDADGVLINSRAPVVKIFNKLLKTDYKQEDLNSWTAIFEWAMNRDLLRLKAEMSLFNANRILSEDRLGGLKWTLNSVQKMLLIISSLGT